MIESVVDGDRQLVTDIRANQRTGNTVAVCQSAHRDAAEIDIGTLRIERVVHVRPVCGRAASADVMAFLSNGGGVRVGRSAGGACGQRQATRPRRRGGEKRTSTESRSCERRNSHDCDCPCLVVVEKRN